MTKDDLKTGMILEFDNGNLSMVLKNTHNGDIVSGDIWFPLEELNSEDLSSKHFNVVSVFRPLANADYLYSGKISKDDCVMVWKREEIIEEMTLEQICEALGKNIKIVK